MYVEEHVYYQLNEKFGIGIKCQNFLNLNLSLKNYKLFFIIINLPINLTYFLNNILKLFLLA
jgi:hypothetical protein